MKGGYAAFFAIEQAKRLQVQADAAAAPWRQLPRVYIVEADYPPHTVHLPEFSHAMSAYTDWVQPECHSSSRGGLVPVDALDPNRVRPCRKCWPASSQQTPARAAS